MKLNIFKRSIVGYKNIIKNKSTQDYMKVEKIDNSLICTIADGHSDDFFTESYNGAKFACEATIDILKKYISYDMDKMKLILESKDLQKEICDKWKCLVLLDMKKKLPNVFKFNLLKYGTTLLTVLINEYFILYMRLGDGNILINNNKKIERILPVYKSKVINSMSEKESYEKIQYKIEKNENNISDIIMFSDGFENSFIYYDKMIDNIKNTIVEYKKSVFSKYNLEKTYGNYLNQLSKNRSFDDISIIFVNIVK